MAIREREFAILKSALPWDGLPQSLHTSGWPRVVFVLCAILLLQQSVAMTVPRSTTQATDNNGTSSSSALVVERKTTVLTPGQMAINAVPELDRGTFLTYQLAVGLQSVRRSGNLTQWMHTLEDLIGDFEQRNPHFKNVPIYGNFAADLLQWLMEKFHLSPEDVYNQLRSRSTLLCTSDGVCYSSNDLVCFCCPF